jgi:hypothetical protein
VAAVLQRCGRPREDVEREIENRLGTYDAEPSAPNAVANGAGDIRRRIRNRVRGGQR